MAKKKTVKDVEAEEVKKNKKKVKEEEVEIEEVEEELEDLIEDEEEDKKSKKKKQNKKEGYFKLLSREMKKVVWPSVGDVVKYSLCVIIFCLVLCAFFIGIDAIASLIKGWLS